MADKMILRGLRRKIAKLLYPEVDASERAERLDIVLHEYSSYEEYRDTQVFHNKRKINNVWADEKTLGLVADRVKQEFDGSKIKGLCHGTRNGFEQNHLAKVLDGDVLGTDISDTANDFPNSVEWDFHNVNEDWIGQFNFIYTNSLDQSWKPKDAVTVWLDQLAEGGLLFIEHTHGHDPRSASKMDPFGVRPIAMPYVLSDWFGHDVSVEIITSKKSNMDQEVWLFVVKRLTH